MNLLQRCSTNAERRSARGLRHTNLLQRCSTNGERRCARGLRRKNLVQRTSGRSSRGFQISQRSPTHSRASTASFEDMGRSSFWPEVVLGRPRDADAAASVDPDEAACAHASMNLVGSLYSPIPLATLMMIVALSACSSESPSQQCTDVVNTLCNRLAQCEPDAGSASSCESMVMQSFSCANVTSVNGNVSACESAINSESCADFISQITSGQPPSACQAN